VGTLARDIDFLTQIQSVMLQVETGYHIKQRTKSGKIMHF